MDRKMRYALDLSVTLEMLGSASSRRPGTALGLLADRLTVAEAEALHEEITAAGCEFWA